MSSKFFDINPAGTAFGAHDGPFWELRHLDATVMILRRLPVPQPQFPNATERFGGGGLVADGTHLFHAAGPETEILKFSVDGALLERMAARNSWFRMPREDMPADLTEFFHAMKDWRATSVSTLFELSDTTLMIQYSNRERGGGY